MNRLRKMLLKHDREDASNHLHSDATMAIVIAEQESIEEEESSQWGGSVPGRSYIRLYRESAHALLHQQYFSNPCIYQPETFRRRFRMNKHLCERIMCDIANHDNYFVQRRDATGRLRFSTMQKVACAIRQLAYSTVVDFFDDTWGIAESTSIEILKKFLRAIFAVYHENYLRRPTAADLHLLLAKAEERGFLGMLGSLDCMHWRWRAYPKGWEGQFSGYRGRATIILEAVASYNTWTWHAFFGLPGSLNDLNVLAKSPLFYDVCLGTNHLVDYEINGRHYSQGYYLVYGIYPQWSIFVKTISHPASPQHQHFVNMQEAYRWSTFGGQ